MTNKALEVVAWHEDVVSVGKQAPGFHFLGHTATPRAATPRPTRPTPSVLGGMGVPGASSKGRCPSPRPAPLPSPRPTPHRSSRTGACRVPRCGGVAWLGGGVLGRRPGHTATHPASPGATPRHRVRRYAVWVPRISHAATGLGPAWLPKAARCIGGNTMVHLNHRVIPGDTQGAMAQRWPRFTHAPRTAGVAGTWAHSRHTPGTPRAHPALCGCWLAESGGASSSRGGPGRRGEVGVGTWSVRGLTTWY